MSTQKAATAQRLLDNAHLHWAKGQKPQALQLALQAATVLNDALTANVPPELRSLCVEAITLAERIKTSSIPFDEALLWLCSVVNGSLHPPVTSTVFVYDEPLDTPRLALSQHQQALLREWTPVTEHDWSLNGITHIYQDLLQDCSFVTALISLARNNAELLHSSITPHSASHRYGVVLHFNGSPRLVEVSNELPVLSGDKSLFIRSRTNADLYWPAFLEKAYLTIKGSGYDPKGSNTSIDTFMLSGWLPEFISASQRPDMDSLWDKLYTAFQTNGVVLALGTGSYPNEQFEPNHDYAITEMVLSTRSIVVKNPWMKNITVMKFSEVFDHFDTMYLNWNPSAYEHHDTIHCIWNNPNKTLYHSPQICIRNDDVSTSEVKVLVERHQGSPDSNIGLKVYRTNGERLFSKTVPFQHDLPASNNTGLHLSTITLTPGECCTAVILNDSTSRANFTLHTYSNSKITLQRAQHKYRTVKTIEDSWDVDTCGGNWSYQSYIKNPQYELSIEDHPQDVEVQLGLFAESDTLVNAQLFFWEDALTLTQKASLITEKYQPGSLTTQVRLSPGKKYKLILSTYDPDVHCKFKLVVCSEVGMALSRITTRLGLFVKPFAFAWNQKNRFRVTFRVSRETYIRAHLWCDGQVARYRPKIRASLFYKDSTPIQINEEFDDNLFGIWTNKVSVQPGQDVILLVERFELGTGEVLGEIGSDYKIELVKN